MQYCFSNWVICMASRSVAQAGRSDACMQFCWRKHMKALTVICQKERGVALAEAAMCFTHLFFPQCLRALHMFVTMPVL